MTVADYSEQVLADAPYLYWPLNETSGTVADDAAGTRNGGLYDGASFVADPASPWKGQAINLDDGRERIDGGTLASAANITAEMWFVLDDLTHPDGGIAGLMHLSTSTWVWYLRVNGSTLEFGWNNGGERKVTGAVLTAGTWNHVAATSAGGVGRIYLNGAEVGTASYGVSVPASSGIFRVGADWANTAGTWPWNGRAAHVAYYHVDLSAARVKAHYDAMFRVPNIWTDLGSKSPMVMG